MSTHGSFWTPENKATLHESVSELFKWNPNPAEAANYRNRITEESDQYVLCYGEELHLADHIAFLAQVEEGAKHVSVAGGQFRRRQLNLCVMALMIS